MGDKPEPGSTPSGRSNATIIRCGTAAVELLKRIEACSCVLCGSTKERVGIERRVVRRGVEEDGNDERRAIQCLDAGGSEDEEMTEVPLDVLQVCVDTLNMHKAQERVYLHDVLQGSTIVAEPPKPKKKDPKLVRRLKRLREEQENKQYKRMVENISQPKKMRDIQASIELRSFQSQMNIAMNVLATMGTAFAIGWFIAHLATGDYVTSLVWGIVGCIVGMFVDVWLFVIQGSKLDAHLDREERRRKRGRGGRSKILDSVPGLTEIVPCADHDT